MRAAAAPPSRHRRGSAPPPSTPPHPPHRHRFRDRRRPGEGRPARSAARDRPVPPSAPRCRWPHLAQRGSARRSRAPSRDAHAPQALSPQPRPAAQAWSRQPTRSSPEHPTPAAENAPASHPPHSPAPTTPAPDVRRRASPAPPGRTTSAAPSPRPERRSEAQRRNTAQAGPAAHDHHQDPQTSRQASKHRAANHCHRITVRLQPADLTFELRLRYRRPHPVTHDDPAPQLRFSPPGAHCPRHHAQIHKGRLFRTRIPTDLARERIRGILRHLPRGMALRLVRCARSRSPHSYTSTPPDRPTETTAAPGADRDQDGPSTPTCHAPRQAVPARRFCTVTVHMGRMS